MSCQFFGCLKPICEYDKFINDPRAKQFCDAHSREILTYIIDENVKKMRDFYERAEGRQQEGVAP